MANLWELFQAGPFTVLQRRDQHLNEDTKGIDMLNPGRIGGQEAPIEARAHRLRDPRHARILAFHGEQALLLLRDDLDKIDGMRQGRIDLQEHLSVYITHFNEQLFNM